MDAFYKIVRWDSCQNNFVSSQYIFLSFLTVYKIIEQNQHYLELFIGHHIFRFDLSFFYTDKKSITKMDALYKTV